MSLRNLTSKNITVKTKSIVAQVAVANVVPPYVNTKESPGIRKTEGQKNKIPR